MKKGLISLLFLLSCGVWDAAAQDLIVKKDGTNVEAKVLEIGEKDIKYKKASHLDGPTYLVSVANVVYIRFEDGSTDIFSQEDYDRLAAEAKNPAPQKQPKRSAPSAFAGRYQPGDYFDENGVRGIVIEVDAEGHGIVMSIAQANLRWCEFKKSDAVRLGLDDQHDGAVNQAAFARMADEGKVRWEDYPAFKWCRALGEGWYLPAINEVLRIGHLYNNGRIKFDRNFETVKFFTGKFFQKYNFTPVFYDIETTGLSRNSTYLYLIGAVGIEDETWNFYQWMAENVNEEETILRIFSQFLQQCDLLISYNGDRFDQPYLEARCEKYGIPSPFTGKQSLDLYLTLKPLKSLLKLSAMKQPCMEEFLGIKDRIYDNGKECIKLYKDFLKKRDAFTADEILGHNLEDVLGLGRIFDMLGYLCIYDGDYEVTYSEFDGDNLILKLKL